RHSDLCADPFSIIFFTILFYIFPFFLFIFSKIKMLSLPNLGSARQSIIRLYFRILKAKCKGGFKSMKWKFLSIFSVFVFALAACQATDGNQQGRDAGNRDGNNVEQTRYNNNTSNDLRNTPGY